VRPELNGIFTFCVCTYNSASTLRDCLESIRSLSSDSRLIVVDHDSQDSTHEIASEFSAEIHKETKGLGYARQLCFSLVDTEFIVFVDSDVQVMRSDFLRISREVLARPKYGAVVGVSLGHRFAYGLPASLLILRKADFEGEIIPDYIDARETYFIQRRLETMGLKTFYVSDAMVHRSQYRRYKPEWEGANTRILPSPRLGELTSALRVIVLMSLNSRNAKNIVYVPVFFLKFLVGYTSPSRWLRLKREQG
jgi:glycosyltransferase involved in cell wall biosynthesis